MHDWLWHRHHLGLHHLALHHLALHHRGKLNARLLHPSRLLLDRLLVLFITLPHFGPEETAGSAAANDDDGDDDQDDGLGVLAVCFVATAVV